MSKPSVNLQELLMRRSDTMGTADSGSTWDAAFICNGLYVGSLRSTQDAASLKDHNIAAVLTVAGRLRVDLPAGIHHLAVDIPDHPGADILQTLSTALPFIDRILSAEGSNDVEQAVLVHCASGVSRSVSVCCAWLMLRRSMTFEDALALVRTNRPLASPNLGFHAQLTILSSVLQSASGDAAVEAAQREYKSKLGEGTLMDTLFAQRREANEIHGAADALEDAIKQPGDLRSCDRALLDSWRAELNVLLTTLHAVEDKARGTTQRSSNETVESVCPAPTATERASAFILDKPAAMIRRAALSKIQRLLADIN